MHLHIYRDKTMNLRLKLMLSLEPRFRVFKPALIITLSTTLLACAGSPYQLNKLSSDELTQETGQWSIDDLCNKYMRMKTSLIEYPTSNMRANLDRKLSPAIENELDKRGKARDYCYDSSRMEAFQNELAAKREARANRENPFTSSTHCTSQVVGNNVYTTCY